MAPWRMFFPGECPLKMMIKRFNIQDWTFSIIFSKFYLFLCITVRRLILKVIICQKADFKREKIDFLIHLPGDAGKATADNILISFSLRQPH